MKMRLRLDDTGRSCATRRRGFTLLELLTVLLIIGLLASVLLIKYQQARNAAWKQKARDTARQLATAWNAYCIDNSGFPTNGLVADPTYNTDANSITFETTTNNMALLTSMDQSAAQRRSGMQDKWGRYYHVRLDINYDGMVRSPLDNTIIHANVIAWSIGPYPNTPSNSWVMVWPQ